MPLDYDPSDSDAEQKTHCDAARILSDLTTWQAAPRVWRDAAEIMKRLAAALSAGDLAGVASATVDLEVLSDHRVGKVGDHNPDLGPPSKKLRDVAEYLVHELKSGKDNSRDPADDDKGIKRTDK